MEVLSKLVWKDREAVTTQLRHARRIFGFNVVRPAESQDHSDAYFCELRLYAFSEKQIAGKAKR